MTQREDLFAALECRQPGTAVPLWELEFHAWDAFSGRHVVLGSEFAALPESGRERTLYENAEILLSVSEKLHFSALTPPGGYWNIAPGVLAYYVLPGEYRFRQIEILSKLKSPNLTLIAGSGGVMAMPSAEEYVTFAYQLYDSPEVIEERARQTLLQGLDTASRMRDCGVAAVFTASDIADNHGPYFNRRQMDRYVLPYLSRWAEAVKAMGMYAILHTDGNIMPYMDEITSSGIHALQAIDPVAGMDIGVVKDRWGRQLCLCGNVDCGLLLRGTPDGIYQASVGLLQKAMPNGGFVLGASNAVQPEVPIENYLAMIMAWEDHGRY